MTDGLTYKVRPLPFDSCICPDRPSLWREEYSLSGATLRVFSSAKTAADCFKYGLEQQIGQLDQEMASLLCQHRDAVERLAALLGLSVDSAQQIIAEVGPMAATFLRRSSSPRGWAPGPRLSDRNAGSSTQPSPSSGFPSLL